MDADKCIVCQWDQAHSDYIPESYKVKIKCPRCGEYFITPQAVNRLGQLESTQKYILLGVLRRAREEGMPPPEVSGTTLTDLISPHNEPPSIVNKLDLALGYIVDRTQVFGGSVEVNVNRDYPVAYAKNANEFSSFLGALIDLGRIRGHAKGSYVATVEGIQHIESLRSAQPGAGNQCFVAMWFSDDMYRIYEDAFSPAIRAAGYNPIRIDLVPHNEAIDSRILVEIRRSRLVVADLTGHRGGVYLEGGFAMGLGIPVIWTCRTDHADSTHFDIRQFNQIRWSDAKELREKLQYRILATVPLTPRLPVSGV